MSKKENSTPFVHESRMKPAHMSYLGHVGDAELSREAQGFPHSQQRVESVVLKKKRSEKKHPREFGTSGASHIRSTGQRREGLTGARKCTLS